MIRIHLNEEERATLRARARQEVGRVAERIHFVLLSDQGKSPPEIAAIFGYSTATVRLWLKRYRDKGPDGLYDGPRSGRPPKANESVRDCLRDGLQTTPQALGYLATLWTVPLLVLHLLGHGWQVGSSTVRRVLHSLGYRWRRPRLRVPHRDPAGSARMAAIARAVAETQPEDHFFCADESEFKLLPVLRAMWRESGQPFNVSTPPYNAGVWAFGALDILNGQWLWGLYDRQTAANFVAFLEQIEAACPTGRIRVAVDHASAHTAKAVAEWLAEHPRVEILFLPKYASHLNPVERIWGVAKNRVVANHCYSSLAALRQAVQQYLASITPEAALQTAGLNV